MCSPTCDLCRTLDNRGLMSTKQVCQMVLMNRDNSFLLRRCCTAAYSIQRTPLQSTALQGTATSQKITVQSFLQNTPSNTSIQRTGQGPAPYKTEGTPNTALQSTGQAPALHKADGASYRPKGPDAVTRSKAQAPAPNKAKGASSTQAQRHDCM